MLTCARATLEASLSDSPPPSRLTVAALACLALLLAAVACDTPAGTPRPSPSLIVLQFTPQPSRSASPTSSAAATFASWPIGWDVAFCEMFSDAIIAQQLIVDVERALDEDNRHDARLLADELTLTATHVTELLAELPDWSTAADADAGIATLMDLGARAGREYHDYFANDKRAALRRARHLRRQNADQVPPINDELEALADRGLACPGANLVLESPS